MNQSIEVWVLIGLASLFILTLGIFVYRRIPKKLKTTKYQDKWRELQGYCKDKETWKDAVIAADKLLDSALRRRKFKGGSMGERLVSAKKYFTNNDAVWFSHNLYKKVVSDADLKLKEEDVKRALLGFRQALRDVGALESDQPSSS